MTNQNDNSGEQGQYSPDADVSLIHDWMYLGSGLEHQTVTRDEAEKAIWRLHESINAQQARITALREACRIQKEGIDWMLGPPINGTPHRTRWNAHAALLREVVADHGHYLRRDDGTPSTLLRRIEEALERYEAVLSNLSPEIMGYEARITVLEQERDDLRYNLTALDALANDAARGIEIPRHSRPTVSLVEALHARAIAAEAQVESLTESVRRLHALLDKEAEDQK